MAGREALQPILSPSFRRLQFANRSPKTRLPPSLFLSTMVSSDSIDGGSSGADGIRLLLFRVKKLSHNGVLPSRASTLSAGYDLSSAAAVVVPARGKALVPTDLSIAIPDGTYARIAPRSGLAWKYSIDVGAGVVDADYRGPVGVILFNHSDADFEVKPGDRIAQLILERIMTPEVIEALTWAPLPGATADSDPQVCDVIKLGLHSLFIMLRNSVSAT